MTYVYRASKYSLARELAQDLADINQSPVGVWHNATAGWFAVTEDPDFEESGYVMLLTVGNAAVLPSEADHA